MSFRKIIFGLLTLWLGLLGLAFGGLFVLCLSLYLLWHGLSTSLIVFGGLCPACIILAQVALRRTTAQARRQLSAYEPALLPEEQSRLGSLAPASAARARLKRSKLL